MPQSDDFGDPPLNPSNGVIVATTEPVPLRVVEIPDDDRAPAGMTVLGSFLGDRLIARSAVPREVLTELDSNGIFQEPVRLALAAREAPPGLRCELYALVTIDPSQYDDDPVEPWADSLPGHHYDRTAEPNEPRPGDEPNHQQAAVLLGQIVRFDKDRKFPTDLIAESADVLGTIVNGKLVEVVDKVLDDLLGSQ